MVTVMCVSVRVCMRERTCDTQVHTHMWKFIKIENVVDIFFYLASQNHFAIFLLIVLPILKNYTFQSSHEGFPFSIHSPEYVAHAEPMSLSSSKHSAQLRV